MKTGTVVLLAIVASASAFTGPMMATRAIKPKKAAPKKGLFAKKAAPKKAAPKKGPFAKKAVAKAAPVKNAPPASAGYPSFADKASSFKISGISGGGNKGPQNIWTVPDFSDPKLQKERDPAFYAAAAATRLTKAKEFVYEDGLTELERTQKATIPLFLTGSAKSQVDQSAIVGDIEGVDYFGLSSDRFQLLMISIFGLFTLVGSLSGNLAL